jgi:hypothetical protein
MNSGVAGWIVIAVLSGSAAGQCDPVWLQSNQTVQVSSPICGAAVWDSDGSGPVPEVMLFTTRGFNASTWTWDGEVMRNYNASLRGGEVRNVVSTSHGVLATGTFTHNRVRAVRGIARWTGSSWEQFGTPLSPFWHPPVEYQGRILVVVSDSSNSTIKQWDGQAWVTFAACDGFIGGMYVDGVNLYTTTGGSTIGGVPVAGCVQYDGQTWREINTGLESAARIFGLHEQQPVAIEYVTSTEGWLSTWNGERWIRRAWSPTEVYQSVSFRDEIVVGGYFGIDVWPQNELASVARLDGNRLVGLDGGFDSLDLDSDRPVVPEAFLVWRDRLYAGGDMRHVASGERIKLRAWDGHNWRPVVSESTMTGTIHALKASGDQLVACGAFRHLGAENADYIAAWDGFDWKRLGGGLDGPVFALLPYDGGMIAVGDFATADGNSANRVAYWDGEFWTSIGDGFDAPVRAAAFWRGELVVGGDFTRSGETMMRHLARWDGQRWHEVGGGLDGSVRAIVEFNGELCVGGSFQNSGGVHAPFLARWDGNAWSGFGTQPNQSVLTLMEERGSLLVGGLFSFIDSLYSLGIARWTPSIGWESVGNNLGFSDVIERFQGSSVMGGYVPTNYGPFPAVRGIDTSLQMDFSTGGGEPTGVKAMSEFQDALVVGGNFGRTPDGVYSAHFARWSPDPVPQIAQPPQDTRFLPGSTVTLRAAPVRGFAERSGGVDYRWQRDGVNLIDGPGGASPGGGIVAGALGTLTASRRLELRLDNARPSDAGAYTLVLTNACGHAVSVSAALTVEPSPCPADLNADGFLDLFDYDLYITAFESGTAAADFNADGFADFFDYLDYVTAFEAGC